MICRCVHLLLLLLTVFPLHADDLHELSVLSRFGNPELVSNAWIPLQVTLVNKSPTAASGRINAMLPGPNGDIELSLPITIPGRSRVVRTLYAPPMPAELSRDQKPPIFALQAGGTQIAQGQWLAHQSKEVARSERRSTLLVLRNPNDSSQANDEFDLFTKTVSGFAQTSLILWEGTANTAPRHLAGYDSCRLVVLCDGVSQMLDPLQRETLLQFVRGGGTLLVNSPLSLAASREPWLESYLPVKVIGRRWASQVSSGATTIELSSPTQLCEAVSGTGTATLGDQNYVYAAYTDVGLGRIAFSAFSVAAPLDKAMAARICSDTLAISPAKPVLSSGVAQRQAEIIGEMIGLPAPSRRLAAAIMACLFVLTVSAHVAWRGALRPRAFTLSCGAAILGTLGLLASAAAQKGGVPLSMGRIDVVHLRGDAGYVEEIAGFLGDASTLALSTDGPSTTLRPLAYDSSHPPALEQLPFASPSSAVAPRRIDRLWTAARPLTGGASLSASAKFDSRGLLLTIENKLGASIEAPVLLFGRSVYRLPTIQQGSSQIQVTGDQRNPESALTSEGDGSADAASKVENWDRQAARFVNGGAMLSSDDRLRAKINMMVEMSADVREMPALAGWINPSAPLVHASVPPQVDRVYSMLRSPVSIEPAVSGAIHIDAGCTQIITPKDQIPIYDEENGVWVSSTATGVWMIGIKPPAKVGRLKLVRGTLHADVNVPEQNVSLRRGQMQAGVLRDNAEAPLVAGWQNTFGPQPAKTMEFDDNDVDADGVLWLRLEVQPTNSTAEKTRPWRLNALRVDLDAQVH